MLSGVLDAFKADPQWTNDKINLVLTEYGADGAFEENPSYYWDSVTNSLRQISSEGLLELADFLGLASQTKPNPPLQSPSLWEPDLIRVFLSHSAHHKKYVAEISVQLRHWGIHGFVAHETMTVAVAWQGQIEAALQSCEFFVGLVHTDFNNSPWCNQEVGWAYGRNLPMYFLRIGSDPQGFPASLQWPSVSRSSAEEAAKSIAFWVAKSPEHTNLITSGLIRALSKARSYIAANRIAIDIVEIDHLTPEQWKQLDQSIMTNDQIYPSHIAWETLIPFYDKHHRAMPL
ncbi:toll/interleukin-1 receptor domain-containing protein [Ferrimicrobium sp.]|uniref:toll/interleukin-1 receptor domain-containing protein n=1 Tax=Ferrimicrobium sp. TaxID=2926050 RepID=UPI0026235773|nr:toll/interleukin-1 receptor domain-containing protein [Ferrimicrobium sp.]